MVDFLSVGAKDIMFAAAEVGVDLAWKDGILGDVGLARVVIQRQGEEPGYADEDAES